MEEVLEKFFEKKDNHYIVDYIGYKKILYHKYQETWLKEIRPYYHKSKRFYIDRKFTFGYFINLIRQICKLYNIEYKGLNDKTTGYKYFKYFVYI